MCDIKIKPNKKRLTWYNLRLLYQVVNDEMSSCIYVYEIPKLKMEQQLIIYILKFKIIYFF